MNILKTLGLLIVGVALVVWVESVFISAIHIPSKTAATLGASPVLAGREVSATLNDTAGTFDATGSVIIDERTEPSVPFLMYQLPSGEVRTKHLIFSSGTTCSSYAGDLPCASSQVAPSVPVSPGQYVHIVGTASDDRVYVDRYTVISGPSVH